MAHNLIHAIKAVANGYCDLHGTSPEECGAAQTAAKAAMVGVGIAWVAGMFGKGHSGQKA